jgi:hypothetical protein
MKRSGMRENNIFPDYGAEAPSSGLHFDKKQD